MALGGSENERKLTRAITSINAKSLSSASGAHPQLQPEAALLHAVRRFRLGNSRHRRGAVHHHHVRARAATALLHIRGHARQQGDVSSKQAS